VINENLDATSGMSVDLSVVKQMVDQSLMNLTGQPDPVSALQSLLPGLDTTKKVAIKVNCLEQDVATRWEVVKGVTDRLCDTLGGTFPPGNITIYDINALSPCGFTGANFPGVVLATTQDPDPNTQVWVGDMYLNVSSHIVGAQYLINCPVIKDHYAPHRWTVGFKNHIGSISPVTCHPYEPRLLALNASPHFKNKTMLLVLSALYGMYDGGPFGNAQSWLLFPEEDTPNLVMLSTDPVTFEHWGIRLIDAERSARGMTIYDHSYCQRAAGFPYMLGTYQLAQQDVITSLPPPTDLAARATGAGAVLLQWSAVTGASKYRVYRSTDPYFVPDPWGGTNLLAETTLASYTDPNGAGDPGTNYYYVVRAYRACWESADSARVGEFDFET
jgi:hypothetical protein